LRRHALVGGLGYLGLNLARAVVEAGEEPVIVARRLSVEKRRGLADAARRIGAKLFIVDSPRIGAGDVEAVEPDVVHHLAGKAGGPRRPQWEAHVGLLREEMEAASRLGARLVYVSSIAVPSDAAPLPPGATVAEEEEHLWGRTPRFETVHAETKAEGERLLVGSRLKWAILRPALVTGRYSYHPEWRLVRLAARLGLAPAAPAPVVSAGDVARVALQAAEGRLDGAWVNLAAPNATLADAALETCRALGRSRCLRVPVGWIAAAGRLAPRTSPARLAWSIMRKRYRFESRVLAGFDWRLEPALEE